MITFSYLRFNEEPAQRVFIMPLLSGKENVGKNIKELIASGHSRDQAIAIALDVARKSGVRIKPKGRHKKK